MVKQSLYFKYIGLTLIILILILTYLPSISNADLQQNYELKINRMVFISDWGLTAVNDTITIVNIGAKELQSINIGFPSIYLSNLKYYTASFQGEFLKIEKKIDEVKEIYWLNYIFPQPLKPKETYNFSSLTVFSGLIRFQRGGYTYSFVEAPVLETQAKLCNVTIFFPSDASIFLPGNSTFKRIGKEPVINHVFIPLTPYYTKILSLNFSSVTLQLLDIYWSERVISIESINKIKVSDSFKIHNPGILIAAVKVHLPEGATKIMAYDYAGPLWSEERTGNEAAVAPRFGDIRSNENFTFKLTYELNGKNFIKQIDWRGTYMFNFNFSSKQPWLIDNLTVKVILPKGCEIKELNIKPEETIETIYQKILVYNFNGVTPLHDLKFTLKYKYSGLWASIKPLQWTLIIESILFTFAVVARKRKITLIQTISAPVETISKFVELYDEKMFHEKELNQIEELKLKKSLPKKEYKNRVKVAEERLTEINKILNELKNELKKSGLRYEELIKKIEKAEAEFEAAKASKTQVNLQYRSGKISKETYETIMEDINKRINKAKAEIENILITLREEI
ncbi:MAG: hypothetical protein QXL69_05210 [Candidatus Bathyarchaeia archaeon]